MSVRNISGTSLEEHNGIVAPVRADTLVASRSLEGYNPSNRYTRTATLQRRNVLNIAASGGIREGPANNNDQVVARRSTEHNSSIGQTGQTRTRTGLVDYNPVETFNTNLGQYINPNCNTFYSQGRRLPSGTCTGGPKGYY